MNWFSSEQNYPKLCISRQLKPKKANWSNQRNLFVVHTGRHSNKTSMWTIYKKHDYECSRMQLDFDKKKKCWCIYRSLELENIFSQISTNSPPPMLSTPSACVSSVGHVCVLVQMLQTGSRALKNGCARSQGPANLLNGVVFFFKKIFCASFAKSIIIIIWCLAANQFV